MSLPIKRLLNNAEKQVAANPSDTRAHYTLARLHYLAFAYDVSAVSAEAVAYHATVIYHSGQVAVPSFDLSVSREDWAINLEGARGARATELAYRDIKVTSGERIPENKNTAYGEAFRKHLQHLVEAQWIPAADTPVEQATLHAVKALAGLRRVCQLDPNNALYHLGLGSLTEQIVDWAKTKNPPRLPPELSALDYAAARAAYFQAFRLAFAEEGKLTNAGFGPTGPTGLLSPEIATGYLRLFERDRERLSQDPEALKAYAEVKTGLERLAKIDVVTLVSPIIFSLKPVDGIARLLAPASRVDFNLPGYGPPLHWSWIQPETGLLVWDPERRGEIVSGRQLFGGFTFQIFRANGYDALAALDDDGNGVLRGGELNGIRAWFDANGDGRSDPGEVRDLEECGIIGISVRTTGNEGPHPMNTAGLFLANGTTLPTWDWTTQPLKN